MLFKTKSCHDSLCPQEPVRAPHLMSLPKQGLLHAETTQPSAWLSAECRSCLFAGFEALCPFIVGKVPARPHQARNPPWGCIQMPASQGSPPESVASPWCPTRNPMLLFSPSGVTAQNSCPTEHGAQSISAYSVPMATSGGAQGLLLPQCSGVAHGVLPCLREFSVLVLIWFGLNTFLIESPQNCS